MLSIYSRISRGNPNDDLWKPGILWRDSVLTFSPLSVLSAFTWNASNNAADYGLLSCQIQKFEVLKLCSVLKISVML
jgi:hypothetical protein